MKVLKLSVLVWLIMAVCAWAGSGPKPISAEEAAQNGGSTHKQVITYKDFVTCTDTNGATYTNSDFVVAAKMSVQLWAAKLIVPFEYSTTSGLSSITLIVGDGTDTDLFLDSMEIDKNNTPIYVKKGRGPEAALAQTTGTFLTNQTPGTVTFYAAPVSGGTCTNPYTVLTNHTFSTAVALLTSALTTSQYGQKVYTTDDTVDLIFTPTGTNWGLSQCDKGEIQLYWKIIRLN